MFTLFMLAYFRQGNITVAQLHRQSDNNGPGCISNIWSWCVISPGRALTWDGCSSGGRAGSLTSRLEESGIKTQPSDKQTVLGQDTKPLILPLAVPLLCECVYEFLMSTL